MEAELVSELPTGDGWQYEPKWDGFRCLAGRDGAEVTLTSKSGKPLAVIGKTGTLPATDGGVSTLAGFIYTRERGVLLFAIFNTQGNVNTFRKLQDSLIKDLISECGGAELSASLHKPGN